jgi:hypothetical protein
MTAPNGGSGASRIAFRPAVRPGGLAKCAWSWTTTRPDGPPDVAGASQPRGISGQPALVRAPEPVPVARAGRDDVGTAVIRRVKPAHLCRGDDDAAGHVVGDQAQEPLATLARSRSACAVAAPAGPPDHPLCAAIDPAACSEDSVYEGRRMKVTDRNGPVVPGLRPAAICDLTDNQPPPRACPRSCHCGTRLAIGRLATACVWRFRGARQDGRDANRSLCAQRKNAVILLFCYSGYRECRMMLRPGIDTANPAFHSVR